MYRVSPLTYIVDGIAGTGLHGRHVECSSTELNVFNPPSGQTCGQYLKAYLAIAPGNLHNPSATTKCQYCPLTTSDQFLAGSAISWSTRWRNFGIVWAYICFNIIMTMALYYAFRVKKWDSAGRKKRWARVGIWVVLAGRFAGTLLLGTVGQIIYR
jgi:ATP-binding cassette, subfamily G (WHITE), member 2, PDR